MFDHSDTSPKADAKDKTEADIPVPDTIESPNRPPEELRPIQDLLDAVGHAADGESIAFGDILRAMDARSQPVLLLLPALILVSPISGIPGLSSLGGLTIALVAAQILIGRETIWLPGFLLRRRLPTARLLWALSKLERPAAFIDRKTGARAEWVFAFPGRHLALLICMACGLIMPFFELVPFSATTLAIVVSIMASALVVRDGILAALGLSGFGFAVLLIVKLAAT